MQSGRSEDAHSGNPATETATVHSQREAGAQQEVSTDREGNA